MRKSINESHVHTEADDKPGIPSNINELLGKPSWPYRDHLAGLAMSVDKTISRINLVIAATPPDAKPKMPPRDNEELQEAA